MRSLQSFYDCNQVLSGKLPVAPELRSRIKAGEKKNKGSSPGKIIKRAGNSPQGSLKGHLTGSPCTSGQGRRTPEDPSQ